MAGMYCRYPQEGGMPHDQIPTELEQNYNFSTVPGSSSWYLDQCVVVQAGKLLAAR